MESPWENSRRDHAADADGVRTAMANLLGNSEGVVGPNMRRPSPQNSRLCRWLPGCRRGFLKNLAHLAGHVAGVFFLALEQHFGGAKDNLGAARSGYRRHLAKALRAASTAASTSAFPDF